MAALFFCENMWTPLIEKVNGFNFTNFGVLMRVHAGQ